MSLRVAVLSDVHGNAFALEAVLKDLRATAPDLIINLGDQVEGAANPQDAFQMQAGLNAVQVRGNNEEKFWPDGRRTPLTRSIGAWLDTQLSPEARSQLAGLPLTARLLDGEVFACHGSPQSAWESLLWMWQREETGRGFYRSRDPRELRAVTDPLGARVVLCGHTHRPGSTQIGDALVVNVGAVSDQLDTDPRARWALLERRGGRWTADFRTVDYDVEAAVNWARRYSPFGEFEEALLMGATFEQRSSSEPRGQP